MYIIGLECLRLAYPRKVSIKVSKVSIKVVNLCDFILQCTLKQKIMTYISSIPVLAADNDLDL